ncbi:MAG: HAD family phosphatase [Planctomycetes bacterium]|nr:HAD family phosphatase [Planctomycetota bacterium]MBM4083449.1 HAD family phosphatase [Planctomycetota bacterium]
MIRYKLLAVDVDGTLSVPGDDVPKPVIESLSACVHDGIRVVPATGKKFSSIQSLCNRIGIRGPAITCNGAIALDARTGAVLFSHFIPRESYQELIRTLAQDTRLAMAVFTDKDIVCTDRNLASLSLAAIGEPTTRFVRSLYDLSAESVAKVLVAVGDVSVLRDVGRTYAQRFAESLSVTITSDKFVEFMCPGVSKGHALTRIAELAGIHRQAIACIGDSDNDLSMFAVAGLSIAVANATDSVLQAADVVAPSAAECGAALAIAKLILERSGPSS